MRLHQSKVLRDINGNAERFLSLTGWVPLEMPHLLNYIQLCNHAFTSIKGLAWHQRKRRAFPISNGMRVKIFSIIALIFFLNLNPLVLGARAETNAPTLPTIGLPEIIKKIPSPFVNFIKKVFEGAGSGFLNIWRGINSWFQRVTGYTLTQTLKAILKGIKNLITWVYNLILKLLEWIISLFP